MKGEVDRAKISKIVAAIDISQRSKTVMEKASILANAFDSDVYLLSVVEMRHTNAYVCHTIAGKHF
jgi:nucleotide-binding universal stress UspA family protein